jgi:histidyl-tRNA synthetase
MITKPRGTQDFLSMDSFNYIISTAKKILVMHNFSEIQTPILESIELFKRSLGIYTDVVGKEMFTIAHADGKSQPELCLRPEMTASFVRAFLENNIDATPWRVFSYGPVFRHERPQKGRYRQFHQINIELIGGASIGYDAQLISLLDLIFKEGLGMQGYHLELNFLGCPNDRVNFKSKVLEFLQTISGSLCQTCMIRKDTNTLRIFDCKSQDCQDLYKNAPVLSDHLCNLCQEEWSILKDYLNMLNVPFIHSPRLIRGLDYYNKTAFEFSSEFLGTQSSFCGGGRYDYLINQLDSKSHQPAVGAGIGIERLLLLTEKTENQNDQQKPLFIGIPLESAFQKEIISIAQAIINDQHRVEILLDGGLKNNLKKANKMGAKYVFIIGHDESEQKKVTIKNMQTSEQKTISQETLRNGIEMF